MSNRVSTSCRLPIVCENNEYLSDETCVACDNVMSILLVATSLLSFIAITYYMQDKVTDKATMIEVKSIATFFQCAQLTTLVDIPWPKIALIMPFMIPYGDANCLTSQFGWTAQRSFFAYFYGSLLVIVALLCNASRHGAGTLKHSEMYQQLTFLVILIYSPLVQSAASMVRCEDDPDYGWVLSADPRVSCDNSKTRFAARMHASGVVVGLGVGLPAFVLWKMRDLRQKKALTAYSNFAGLFEWYSPMRPYWEAVLLAKKFLLVMAADTYVTHPLAQALIGLAINVVYLAVFEMKRPMLWYPSKTFKKQNLFHVLERGSSVACAIGSVMAVLGAGEAGLVDLVGGLFAGVNFLYVGGALFVFAKDTKLKRVVNLTQVLPVVSSGDDAADVICAKEMREWDDQVRLIDEVGEISSTAKEDMVAELLFVRSKVVAALERDVYKRVIVKHGKPPRASTEIVKAAEDLEKGKEEGKEERKKLVKGSNLHKAAKKGKLEVVRALIEVCHEAGGNLEKELAKESGREALTPLCLAAKEGHAEVCQVLIDGGADVNLIISGTNSSIHSGMAALHIAAEKRSY